MRDVRGLDKVYTGRPYRQQLVVQGPRQPFVLRTEHKALPRRVFDAILIFHGDFWGLHIDPW